MSDRVITQEELNKHNKRDDLWLQICGNVYNLTDYMENHPGGIDRLIEVAPPNDATKEWRRAEGGGHSKGARMKMQKLLVGTLENATPSAKELEWLDPAHKFDRDTLNSQTSSDGMSSTTLAILALAIAVITSLFLPQIKDALGLE